MRKIKINTHWCKGCGICVTLCPKEVLKLMRGEIYARYGDTFADPDTQAYFDAQPWYQKRPGEKITLTDIERYNYALIKQAEQAR